MAAEPLKLGSLKI